MKVVRHCFTIHLTLNEIWQRSLGCLPLGKLAASNIKTGLIVELVLLTWYAYLILKFQFKFYELLTIFFNRKAHLLKWCLSSSGEIGGCHRGSFYKFPPFTSLITSEHSPFLLELCRLSQLTTQQCTVTLTFWMFIKDWCSVSVCSCCTNIRSQPANDEEC